MKQFYHKLIFNIHTISSYCNIYILVYYATHKPKIIIYRSHLSIKEMQYLAIFSILHDNIFRLKITVDNTTRMQVLNCRRYIMCHMPNLIFGQTATILWSKKNLVKIQQTPGFAGHLYVTQYLYFIILLAMFSKIDKFFTKHIKHDISQQFLSKNIHNRSELSAFCSRSEKSKLYFIIIIASKCTVKLTVLLLKK